MLDENVNETAKSIEQNAKRMTLKHTILLHEIENMLLISMYYYFLRFRDLSIEQQNKQTMVHILHCTCRTLLVSMLKYHQKYEHYVFL